MPIQMNVESRFDVAAAEAAARQAKQLFGRAAEDISKSFGGTLSKAFDGLDGSAARQTLVAMQSEYAATARSAEEAERIMTRSARNTELAIAKLRDAQAKYATDSPQVIAASNRVADAWATSEAAAAHHTDAVAAAAAANTKLGAATDDAATKASSMGRVLNGVGLTATASLVGIGVATTDMAAKFQASQERLVASAGESAAGLKTVSDGILQLAGQVGYSVDELSTGMYTVEKAGYRGADGVNVLKVAAEGAKSENADLGEVLNGLTTSMHDFGFGQDQAADVMSKMVAATGMAKTNFQDFSNALHSVEPAAAAVGDNIADVYGSLAQLTQSGMSVDQAAQNMGHAFTTLSTIQGPARDAMGQFGVSAEDVREHLGERGLAGTFQLLSKAITDHMGPDGQVVVSAMKQNADAAASANDMYNAMPPALQKVADSIKNNSEAYSQFRKDRGGLSVEQANEIEQWNKLNNQVTGFSNALTTGQGPVQTYFEVLSRMAGGQDAARIGLQLSGDAAAATNDKIAQVNQTTAEADHTVKGFNETQQTLAFKTAAAKDAFGAAAVELGTAFIPAMTDVANVAKDVGDFMAEHEDLAQGLVYTLGGVATAWAGIRTLMLARDGWDLVKGGYGFVTDTALPAMARLNSAWAAQGTAATASAAEVEAAAAAEATAEDGVATSAVTANTALGGAGAAAEGGIAGVAAAGAAEGGAVDAVAGAATAASGALGGIVGMLGAVVAPLTAIAGLVYSLDQNPATNPGAITAGNHALAQRFGGDAPPTAPHNSFTGTPFAPPSVTDDLPPTVKPQPWRPPDLVVTPGPALTPSATAPGPAQWSGGPVPGVAMNPILTPYAHAAGGLFGAMPSQAMIQPATPGLVQWAEPSTKGEAFIPLGGGDRSKQIWAQTGHLLGVFDQGGFRGDLPSTPGDYVVTPDAVMTAEQFAMQANGRPYEYGGTGKDGLFDCSGFMGALYGILTGQPAPVGTRFFTTESDFSKLGFVPGYDASSPFNIGVNDQHMAGTLDGYNVESGGAGNRTQIGGSAAGALSPEFTRHYHLPGSGYGGGGDEAVSRAEERVQRADARVHELETQQSELKATAKDSERERLENELRFAREDAQRAHDDLGRTQQTAAYRGTDGRSRSGSGSFGAPLPSNMGLGKGLPGLAEWGVDALMNIAAAPALASLGAISDAAGSTGPGGTTGLFGLAAANGMIPGFGGAAAMGPRPLGGGLGAPLGSPASGYGFGALPGPGAPAGIPGVPGGGVTGYTGTAAPLDPMGTPHQNTGTGHGIGMSGGGLLGAAASAGGGAANMFAPGAGVAAQIAMQEASRAIQYGGQVAGEAVEGIQQTLFPDAPMNGPLGKLLGGVVGAHPVMQDTADQAQQGQQGYQNQQGGPGGGGDGGPGGAPGQGGKTGDSPGPLQPGQGNTDNSQTTSGDTVHGNQFNAPVTVQQGQPDPSGMLGFQSQGAGLTP